MAGAEPPEPGLWEPVSACLPAQVIAFFLQGFARPICDLSRGASVDDIVMTCAVAAATA